MRGVPLIALVLLPSIAGAWPANVVTAMMRDARRLLPPSLSRLIGSRESLILENAQRFPETLGQAMAQDFLAGKLQRETLSALVAHAEESVDLLRRQQVSDGVVALGATLRIPADLSDPVLVVGREGYPPGVIREYYAFVEENLEKIPVVLDERGALSLPQGELPTYWEGLLTRSQGQSPVIRTELFQGGRLVDHRSIDYRSPVFGVASLSYSRAVTAIAATWLALWRQAHGDVTRMRSPQEVAPHESEASPQPHEAGP